MKSLEEFAQMLDGREYKREITSAEIQEARDAGYVVVFGLSDDTTVFHGAIEAQVNTTNGGEIYITPTGIFEECACDCKYSREAKARAKKIEAIWCKGPYVWHYETDLPHASFEVIDNQPADNLKFCMGVVFKLAAV